MSTEFFLVRHAEKEKHVGDVSISPEGIKQARKTANHFSKMSIDKMISSPLNRAKQTAQIVAEAIHITVSEDSRLRNVRIGETHLVKRLRSLLRCGIAAPRNETICLQLEIPQEEPVSG